jgi:predicted nucleotidyltransferase component of viral defense system
VTLRFPQTFTEISAWAAANEVTAIEARVRFAQYVILRAITQSRDLSSSLVFKGGNALDFVWQPNRSTKDLDFSAELADFAPDLVSARTVIARLFADSLNAVRPVLHVACRLQRIEQQPPEHDKTFITYHLSIGYALPDQERVRVRIDAGLPSVQAIKVEVSVNESICADVLIDIAGRRPLRVSTLEDIVAEKLRALLQQPLRNRTRRQDLLDIAVILKSETQFDHEKVVDFLWRKARIRNVVVSRSAFRSQEVLGRALVDYAELAATTRHLFVPFEEACDLLSRFVDSLPIPE